MPIDPQAALKDIDAVLMECHRKGTRQLSDNQRAPMLKACLERWAPPGSAYREMSDQIGPFSEQFDFSLSDPSSKMHGILAALRRDYANNMVRTFEEIVHASMFDDFLGQAQSLLDGRHRLAATVVAGAALESHLRELSSKHGVPTTEQKKGKTVTLAASSLNERLQARAKVYGLPESRQVQSWIDLRNEAAHGRPEFQAHGDEVVSSMIKGIQAFMVRNPA